MKKIRFGILTLAAILVIGLGFVINSCSTATSTTTTTLNAFIVRGTILKNECTVNTVYAKMGVIEFDVPPTEEAVTFSNGVASFELSTTFEGNAKIYIMDVPEGMPSFIGGYGITTGDAAVVLPLITSTTEAIVPLALPFHEVNLGTMKMYAVSGAPPAE